MNHGDRRSHETDGPTSSTAPTASDGHAAWALLHDEQRRLRDELQKLRDEQARLRSGEGHDAADAKKKAPPQEETDEAKEKPKKPPLRVRLGRFAADHRRGIAIAAVLLAIAAVAAFFLVRYLGSYESTDDAQVDGDISAISARVTGTVTRVDVVDNQHVNAGDVLAELDPSDYTVAIAQAKAALAQAEAQEQAESPSVSITQLSNQTSVSTTGVDVATAQAELGVGERDADAAEAKLAESEANAKVAERDRERARSLFSTGAIAQAELDRAVAQADATAATLASARANVAAARQRVSELRARIGQAVSRLNEVKTNAPRQVAISQANVAARTASVEAARAALAQAELNLGYTKIVAPVSGIVGKKSVAVGDRVQAGQELLAIVQTDRLWVTADFKETQLEEMHPGQRATVSVDAFGTTYRGEVESLAGASGAKYSLLPPENATGNFVKVVQRLPVRIHLEPGQPGEERLRPGMSVEPKVWIR